VSESPAVAGGLSSLKDESIPAEVPLKRGNKKSSPPSSAGGSKLSKRKSIASAAAGGSQRVKIVKKPRDPATVEAEISALEKRLVELSAEMTKPEVSRDIGRLVELNDEYQQGEAHLAELLDEWERAEASASSSKR
jgi:hypothetical protein